MADPHISVSSLQMHQKCPKQYEFRYVDGLIIPPGIAQIRGKGFHSGVAHNFSQKISTGEDLPKNAVEEHAFDYIQAQFAGEIFLNPQEQTVGLKKLRAKTTDTTVKMVSKHREVLAPAIQPVFVEKKITLRPDPKKFPVSIVGILDLVDDEFYIHDNKTAAKTPSKGMAHSSQQLTMYSILFRALTGKKERGVQLDTVVMTEAGNVSTNIQVSKRLNQDIETLKGRMQLTIKAIDTGVFPPTNPDSWWCSEKWCGYYDSVCPFGKKGR